MTPRSLAWPEERLRRARRDAEAFRRRSLARRAHPRFNDDLSVVPHLFLARESLRVATLRAPGGDVIAALEGRAIWTLDTAVRLAGVRGFLASTDLTAYIDEPDVTRLHTSGLIDSPAPAFVSVDPVLPRPALLIARVDAMPPYVVLSTQHRVVTWSHLLRDIMGTLGWRPDLLTRLEGAYRAATQTDD